MKSQNEHVIARVHEATVELLVSRGPRGWNMDDLAANSGISKRTLYKIVDSREAVVERVVMDGLQESIDKILALVSVEADAARALGKLTKNLATVVCSIETVGRLNEIKLQYPALNDRIKELQIMRATPMQQVFKNGIEQGIIRPRTDPVFVTELSFNIVEFCVAKGYRGQELHHRLTQGMDMLCRGVIADSAALSRYQEVAE